MKREKICLIIFVLFLVSCSQNEHQVETPPIGSKVQGETPAEYSKGEDLFRKNCALCHGEKGKGTERGPSFLSPIYHPNHHGDESFVLAVRNGARAHHWQFGNMPPVPNVNEEEVRQIIGYVRWLQRENKIY
jgi:mono/diheme cytochrome c family protein